MTLSPLPATFRWARPTEDDLLGIATAEGGQPFTYPNVGATAGIVPVGWDHDDQVLVVGHGTHTMERAVAALERWTQFELSWVFPLRRDVPIEKDAVFAFVSRQLGLWSVSVCRVAYVLDERPLRYGFAYGTVGSHPVRGEERFLLEHDPTTDAVTFRITKFSRPAHPLVKLAGFVARRIQARFTRDALARLAAEVAE